MLNLKSEKMKRENESNFHRNTVVKAPFTYIQPDICTGCGVCVEVCPMNAIKMEDGHAVVLRNVCGNCKICVRVCPEGAIM